jgi:hypothetical protein
MLVSKAAMRASETRTSDPSPLARLALRPRTAAAAIKYPVA